MPGIPAKYQETFSRLRRAADQLHAQIESGEFYGFGYFKRRKLIQRVRRLYGKLVGPVSPAVIGSAVTAASVLVLAGCFPATEDTSITPSFVLQDATTIGLGLSDTDSRLNGYLTLADTDGDGDLDLYLAGRDLNKVVETEIVRILGNADGTFGPLSLPADADPTGLEGYFYESGTYAQIRPLTFADVDSDGDLDLIGTGFYQTGYSEGTSFSGLVLATNTGTATAPSFAAAVPYAANANIPWDYDFPITAAEMVDIDLDGDLDLVAVTNVRVEDGAAPYYRGYVYFVPGTPGGLSSDEAIGFPYSANVFGEDLLAGLAITDLDNDGDLDVLLSGYTEGSSQVWIRHIENTSTVETGLSFGAPSLDQFGLTMPARDTNSPPRETIASMAVADIDGDGDQDVILGTYHSYDSVEMNWNNEFFFFENIALPVVEE